MFNFIWSYFKSVLESYGFLHKKGKLLFLGLDNSGKTTLLYLLKENRIIQSKPTLHPSSESLTLGNITFNTFDLGGHKQVRKIWRTYFPAVDAIVFIIDSSSPKRFHEVKEELDDILSNEEMKVCPILILANKIDKENAIGEMDLVNYFHLNGLLTGKMNFSMEDDQRPMEVFSCSLKNRQGYGEGFRWLSNFF
jgi:GTP-binding protein SAR1